LKVSSLKKMLAAGMVIAATGCLMACTQIGNVKQDTVKIAESSTLEDEQPGTGTADTENCSYIGFAGILPINSPVELKNDEYNTGAGYYLECAVYSGDEEIYNSDLIAPGESVVMRPSEFIEDDGADCRIVEQAYLMNEDGTFTRTAIPVTQNVTFIPGD